MGLNRAAGTLATICIHSTLYGIYLVLFVGSLYVLLFRHRSSNGRQRSRPINRTLLTSAIVLFTLITAHWILEVDRLFDAFIRPTESEILFTGKYIAVIALCLAEVIVADITMMYRLYVVWGRSWRVIVAPVLTTVVSLMAGIKDLVDMAHATNLMEYYVANKSWVTLLCSAELATNILVTVLIAYRIWHIDRLIKSRSPTHTNIKQLLVIIVESASIFTILLIIILITFVTDSILDDFALELSSPAIGISFSLIIVRVGLGVSTEGRETLSLPTSSNFRSSGLGIGSRSHPFTSQSGTTLSKETDNNRLSSNEGAILPKGQIYENKDGVWIPYTMGRAI